MSWDMSCDLRICRWKSVCFSASVSRLVGLSFASGVMSTSIHALFHWLRNSESLASDLKDKSYNVCRTSMTCSWSLSRNQWPILQSMALADSIGRRCTDSSRSNMIVWPSSPSRRSRRAAVILVSNVCQSSLMVARVCISVAPLISSSHSLQSKGRPDAAMILA